ncbi:MAG: anti-sigma factor [Actinobacteria bacterium]|nr:anti-sigma factor [Actinomycetota bacterium]
MNRDDRRARYLETGEGLAPSARGRLDLVREMLAAEPTWAEPPPGLADSLTPAPGTQIPVTTSRSPLRRGVVAVAAGLALAGVIWVAGNLLTPSSPDPGIVAVMEGTALAPDAEGVATLAETGSGWWIRLDVSGLPPAADGTYYQGWVWRRGEGVSVGTFHLREGGEDVILWSGVDVADYPEIWITLQDEGAGTEASDRLVMTGDITGLDGD